jgi:glycosyltransferase involved in cell wall biosynthesis
MTAVLHVTLNPMTGPWSLMRELAQAQVASANYGAVGIGVITSKDWPESYAQDLKATGLRAYRATTLQTFGTAQFILQHFWRPPIGKWVEDILGNSGMEKCVVHFHNAWMSGVFLPINVSKRTNVRAVVTFHGVNAVLESMPLRRYLHRWMAQRLVHFGAALTSVDACNLELAERVLALAPGHFTVIPNGVPASVLEAPCWTGEGEFVVGQLGTISERKGWRIAAEAVREVAKTGRRIRLLIAGSGPEEVEVRQIAQESNGAVQYLGQISKPSADFLPRLHALAVMSAHEGLPMSIIESLATGVPVLATAVGGIPEALGNDFAGRLLPRNSKALAASLINLYDSPEAHARLKAGAKALYRQRFDITKIVEQYDSVYRRGRE